MGSVLALLLLHVSLRKRAETLSNLQYSFFLLPVCKSLTLVFGWKRIFPSAETLPFSALPAKQWKRSSLYSGKRKPETKHCCFISRSLLVSLEGKSRSFCGFQPLWRATTLWRHFPTSWMYILPCKLLVKRVLYFLSFIYGCSFLSLPCRTVKWNNFFLYRSLEPCSLFVLI